MFVNNNVENHRYSEITNSLWYKCNKYGVPIGSASYVLEILGKASLICSVVLWRRGTGRQLYGGVSIIAFYILCCFVASNKKVNSNESKIEVISNYLSSIEETFIMVLNPMEMPNQNGWAFTLFVFTVLALSIWDKILEHILTENRKAKLHDRGESYLLKYFKRRPTSWDFSGNLQRVCEPVLTLGIGFLVNLFHSDIGSLLITSGFSLAISEYIHFSKSAVRR